MKLSDNVFGFFKKNVSLIGLAILVAIATIANSSFLTLQNISNVTRQVSIVGPMAIGMTFVILCGSIDLSVGSIFSFAGLAALYFSQYSVVLAVVAALVAGASIGFINGLLIGKMNIPPFVSTLSTMMFVRGLVLVLTGEISYSPPNELPQALQFISQGTILTYITVPFVIFLILSMLASWFLNRCAIGRHMYIVGGNPEASSMMGVSTSSTLIIAHTLSGVMTGVAGLIMATRIRTIYPLAGSGYELVAIASVVLGGASLNGGIGKMSGTFVGALIMGLFTNMFNMQKWLDPLWEKVITGFILLVVVLSQSFITHYKKKRAKALA